ncbi:CPXCG motif-containing cysteine-rich protein [candidate division KSB1 bacterium]|nr:CPXCG motif-containing cysteine-rich protein [candidate division KSB1 bacterium]RQW06122.1 MAG: CPXCG motif-containing cysteine-rich protein [candidate division KSB1 bacterium]
MKFRDSAIIQCPYCWQKFAIQVDPTIRQQEYVEDCQVCCRPITVIVKVDEKGRPHITAKQEDD